MIIFFPMWSINFINLTQIRYFLLDVVAYRENPKKRPDTLLFLCSEKKKAKQGHGK